MFFIDAAAAAAGAAQGTPPAGARPDPSMFLAFASEAERDAVASALAAQPALGANLPGGRDAAAACGSILEVRLTPGRKAGKAFRGDAACGSILEVRLTPGRK